MEKTIKLAVYFFTDTNEDGLELDKRICWDIGIVTGVANNLHNIKSGVKRNFNSFEEIPQAMKAVLNELQITMLNGKKSKEYKDALRRMNSLKKI